MEKCRTLLIDPHPLLIEGLRSLLSPYPDIKIIGDANLTQDALSLAKEHKPQLIIMEIEQQKRLSFVKSLRNLLPNARILIYTMHSDQRFLLELIQIGILGHVTKNSPITVLLQAIQIVRQGQAFLSCNDPGGHLISLMRKRIENPHPEDLTILSNREHEVFLLLADGMPIRHIAQTLHLSPKTIESHKYNIFHKLHITSLSELIKIALRHGLVQIYS